MRLSKRNPGAGGSGARKCDLSGKAIDSENSHQTLAHQAKIPSKAVLARRWPSLKINRFNGKWCDDATGAKGGDLESLCAFIGRAPRC